MAKGQIAKDNVESIIAAAFGENYIGTVDKKIYVWGDENGEKVQVAISLTCPKTPVGSAAAPISEAPKSMEFTQEETQTLEELLKKFDLG